MRWGKSLHIDKIARESVDDKGVRKEERMAAHEAGGDIEQCLVGHRKEFRFHSKHEEEGSFGNF